MHCKMKTLLSKKFSMKDPLPPRDPTIHPPYETPFSPPKNPSIDLPFDAPFPPPGEPPDLPGQHAPMEEPPSDSPPWHLPLPDKRSGYRTKTSGCY